MRCAIAIALVGCGSSTPPAAPSPAPAPPAVIAAAATPPPDAPPADAPAETPIAPARQPPPAAGGHEVIPAHVELGKVAPDAIRDRLATAVHALDGCYAALRERTTELNQGTVAVRLVVTARGSVDERAIALAPDRGTDLHDPDNTFFACVRPQIAGWTFAGAPATTYDATLALVPEFVPHELAVQNYRETEHNVGPRLESPEPPRPVRGKLAVIEVAPTAATRRDLRPLVARRLPALARCYERGSATDPTLRGKLTFTLDVAADGRLAARDLAGLTPAVRDCAGPVIGTWRAEPGEAASFAVEIAMAPQV